jgi:uncharacterized protein YdhG (YjbR/CyaY superfamily)
VAKTRSTSVGQYIASKPRETRAVLTEVRKAIRKAVPDAREGLSYQIPTYTLDGVPVLYFAGWKAHYSLYPASDPLVAAFKRELAPYERSKGTIRIPYSDPMPVALVERIARFRANLITSRDTGRRGSRSGRTAQLERVRRLCSSLPTVSEKLSHGTPTFFVSQEKGAFKGVFAMFADHQHEDGTLALWVPVAEGLQPVMIDEAPAIYFKPPYVGGSGWIGIRLDRIRDDALRAHLREAWKLIDRTLKKPRSRKRESQNR